MQEAGSLSGTGSDIAAWARDAFALTTSLPGVRRVGLALVEGGGRRLRFTASDRGSEAAVDWCHVDGYEDVPLNTAVRTGLPVIGVLDDLRARYPGFVAGQRTTATAAVAAIPITAAGQTLGGFILFFDRAQPFDAAQRGELSRAGAELGAALRRARRDEEQSPVAPADEPLPSGARAAVHQVPSHPGSVAAARRFLRTTAHAWGVDEETTDTAVLCMSELVTNAVIHAHAGCVLRVLLEPGLLTVTVRDGGNPSVASVEPLEDPLRVHGRGLQLVDALASRWGSGPGTGGTTVWFALELAQGPATRTSRH